MNSIKRPKMSVTLYFTQKQAEEFVRMLYFKKACGELNQGLSIIDDYLIAIGNDLFEELKKLLLPLDK